jgi:hypothetical protein
VLFRSHIGRREIKSKVPAENVAAFIINGTFVVGFIEFGYMQELAKDLPELGE